MKFKCPSCAKVYSIKEELQGKVVKCGCGKRIQIPDSASRKAVEPNAPKTNKKTSSKGSVANPHSKRLTQQQILAAFKSDIEPVRVSLAYRLVTALVSVVMLLLPLVYISIIAGVGFGVYYHAVHSVGILTAIRGRGAILMFLVYVSPIVVGAIAIVFMIKPLFTRYDRSEKERWLNRDSEPLLFAFIDRICEAVHAPEPSRIRVDCDLNASASFRRGYLSMLAGNDLVLTLGMPLVGGMTMQQLAGVIAHEFGHFSQGTGMRLSLLIRRISMWFAQVVYQRDEWDDWLAGAAAELDFRISWILYLAMLMVWLTRKILWILMVIGHAVSGMLQRQMEYDADRHEARLAGSQGFVSGTRQLRKLGLAYRGMQSQMSQFYREGKLADNLPKLLMSTTQHLPKDALAALQKSEAEEKTGWFDTHPCDRDRIENALREEAEGVFHLHRPASELFRNFDAICKGTTEDFYRQIFGQRLKPSEMKCTDKLIEQQDATDAEARVVEDYFFGSFSVDRGLRLDSALLEPPQDPKAELQLLNVSRKHNSENRDEYAKLLEKYSTYDSDVVQSNLAITMHRAGIYSRRMPFTLPVKNLEEAKTTNRKSKRKLEQTSTKLQNFEQAAARRFHSALKLSLHAAVASRITTDAKIQKRTKQLVETLHRLNMMLGSYNEARQLFGQLTILLDQLSGNEANQDYISEVLRHSSVLQKKLTQLRSTIHGQTYPFDHAGGKVSLAEYVIGDHPPADDVGAIMNAGDQLTSAFPELYNRVVGKLVVVAQRVEKGLAKPTTK